MDLKNKNKYIAQMQQNEEFEQFIIDKKDAIDTGIIMLDDYNDNMRITTVNIVKNDEFS